MSGSGWCNKTRPSSKNLFKYVEQTPLIKPRSLLGLKPRSSTEPLCHKKAKLPELKNTYILCISHLALYVYLVYSEGNDMVWLTQQVEELVDCCTAHCTMTVALLCLYNVNTIWQIWDQNLKKLNRNKSCWPEIHRSRGNDYGKPCFILFSPRSPPHKF